jgi:competence protein ComEC
VKRPCVWVCLSAIGGILLGVAFRLDAISLGVILTLVSLALRMQPRYARRICVFGVIFTLFFVRVSFELDQRSQLESTAIKGMGQVVARHGTSMEVVCREPGLYRGKGLTIWTDEPLAVDTYIRFTGTFLPLKRAGNPGGRDDLLEGAARDLWYESDRVQIIDQAGPKTGIRSRLQSAIQRDFPQEIQGLVSALILADRSAMGEEQEEAIRGLGISHLIAISGFHFVLLMFALRFVFRKFGMSPWLSDATGLLVLWGYGGLIGFPISALRALVMMSFLVGGAITRLRVDRINLLFAAAVVLLFIEPFSLFSVGFQLSFSATLSLLVLPNWIGAMFFPRSPLVGKALSPVLAVQLGILPILIHGFGELSLLTILGNLIFAPIFIVVMAVLFLWAGLAMMGISQWFAPLPAMLIKGWITAVAFLPQHFPLMLSLRKPTWMAIVAYYLGFGFFYEASLGRIRFSLDQSKAIFTALLLALLMGVVFPIPTRFWVLDVGQGDALLLTKGSRGILWDAGGSPFSDWEVGRGRVEPALDALGIGRVDLGICTHFDADHVEGMVELVEDGRLASVAMPPCRPGNEWRRELLEAAESGQCFQMPDKLDLQWGDIHIEVFAPYCHKSENNNSLLTRLEVNGTTLWLTGDMEGSCEREWVNQMDMAGDLLKVAHHGSDSSTTMDLLQAMQPEVALISVGKNTYGHPAKAVLDRLEESGIQVYRTDRDGALQVQFQANGYEVIPYRKDRLPFGRWIVTNKTILLWLSLFLGLGIAMGRWKNGEI